MTQHFSALLVLLSVSMALFVGSIQAVEAQAFQINPIDYGDVVTGYTCNIELQSCTNETRFEFYGSFGDIVSIYMTALDSSLDPVISLMSDCDPYLCSQAANDDYDGLNSAIVRFTLSEPNMYYIMPRAFGSTRGRYQLRLVLEAANPRIAGYDYAAAVPAAIGSFMTPTINGLRVRRGPGTNESRIGSIDSGQTFVVMEQRNGWYRIVYNGQDGWVSAQYTRFVATLGSNTNRRVATVVPAFVPQSSQSAVQTSSTLMAYQAFQHGQMIWNNDMRGIYVLFNNGTWLVFADNFTNGQIESDPNLVPPAGLLQPQRGFGKVWRENANVRNGLGWAVSAEQGYTTRFERFTDRSLSMEQPYQGLTYRLAVGGRWTN